MNVRIDTLNNTNVSVGFQRIRQKFESYPIVFSILLVLGTILLTYKFLYCSDSKKEEQPKKEPLPETGSPKPSLTELVPKDDKKKENSESSLTGNISFVPSLTFQKIFLFSRINLIEIDLRSIFLRDENFSGEVFSSVFNELYDDALERVSANLTPSIITLGKVKSFNGELIGSDPHHLYLKVRIDQTTEIELPSHLFFDSEGELIDPIRFYLNDQYHCLSLKDSIRQCKESYGENYFDPERIKQLRNFVYSFDQKWNELLLENDIFSFIPANAIEFRSCDEILQLVPYEKKKIPRGCDIIPLGYRRYRYDMGERYAIPIPGHSLDSLS